MATKQAVIESLHSLQDGLSEIEKIIRTTTTVLLAPSVFGPRVDDIVRLWAERVETDILKFGVDEKICAKYQDGLRKLHSLASKRNKRKSHQQAIKELQADFHADLLQPVMFHGGANPSEAIKQIIAEKIEEIGFDQFNKKADEMSKQTKGRFKGFKSSAPIESISDLREVPDRRILWVLDGMSILESNQRQRLEYGLDMRIQASHPGDAEVTLTNLESFFSDLSTLVFKNPKLSV